MAEVIAFAPSFGKKADLYKMQEIRTGQFIITVDDGKIYLDAFGKRNLIGEAKNTKNLIYGTFYVTQWEYDAESGSYFQTVQNNKVSGDFPLMIDVVISNNVDIGVQEQNSWSKITKIVAENGAITAYCYDSQPDIDLNFRGQEV